MFVQLVAAMHSREDVAVACLRCHSNDSCRALVIDFCIGKTNQPSFEDYLSAVDGSTTRRTNSTDSAGYDCEEAKASLSRSESRFIARVFAANVRPIVDIAVDIFNFFFVSQISH
jgi:hypothetical protein